MHDSIQLAKDMGPATIASYLILKEVFAFIKTRKNGKNGSPVWLVESVTEIKTHMRRHTKLLEKLASKS